MIDLLLLNTVLIFALMTLLWFVSERLGDVSFIDSFWGIGFVIIAGVSLKWGPGETLHGTIIALLVGVWGLRLAVYLFRRWRREGVDKRYERLLGQHEGNKALFSLRFVFLLQGGLLLIVASPVMVSQFGEAVLFGEAALAGLALYGVGVYFEWVGDLQLACFRRDPKNAGAVLDTGLWRYTRHPNYFGDALMWWGIWLIAAETAAGPWTVFAPACMTWLLLKRSGVPPLEQELRETRPGYADYMARTSRFIPWPPKD